MEFRRVLCLSCLIFRAEDGIRDRTVTGVQTCALPISPLTPAAPGLVLAVEQAPALRGSAARPAPEVAAPVPGAALRPGPRGRSEERREGKEGRCGWWPDRSVIRRLEIGVVACWRVFG